MRRANRLGRLLRAATGALLWVAVLVFTLGVLVRRGDPAQVLWLDVGVYPAVYVLGGVRLLWRRPGEGEDSRAWRFLGLATLVFVWGELYYSLALAPLDGVPIPSLADAFYLSWYPFASVAVVLLLRSRVRDTHASVWLDGLVAGLGAACLAAAWALGPLMSLTGSSLDEVVVNLAYPLADLLLILLLVAGCGMVGLRSHPSIAIMIVGLLLTSAADVSYLVLEARDTYAEGGWSDLLWVWGIALFVTAGEIARRRPARHTRSGEAAGPAPPMSPSERRIHDQRRVTALPVAFTVIALVVIGTAQVRPVSGVGVVLADMCVVFSLVRAVVLFRAGRLTEARQLAEVRRQAQTDHLTGLPNRRALYEHLEPLAARSTPACPVSLLLMDLDGFKEVNDVLGHTRGDELLVRVAGRLRHALGTEAFLSRLGGDEFAAALPDTDSASAVEVARAVRGVMTEPLTIEDLRLHVGVSIGVATAPAPACDHGELLRFADIAMYTAKRDRCGVATFADIESPTPDRLRLVEELRGALAGEDVRTNGTLLVYLQPQVRLEPGRVLGEVVGAEALVRWQHPLHGLLGPGEFLPLVEAAGLLSLLAETVLDLALGLCRRWWSGGHPIPVSVNLSAGEVHDEEMPDRIRVILERHDLPGHALVVELTEESLVVDQRRARGVLERIRQLGVGVSIDDYGTGYSSLAYLRHLTVDELKLDRAFITDLARDPAALAITRSTVDLAHSLGLRLVAEGIEDAGCARILAGFGCDVGQGYHIARPMPGERWLVWLDEHGRSGFGDAGEPALALGREAPRD